MTSPCVSAIAISRSAVARTIKWVQAARSGARNIAEGSQASGTSKKTELKLTKVARASLEELRLDFESFLRQGGLKAWPPQHPALMRFKQRRCATLEEVRAWVKAERHIARTNTDRHGPPLARPTAARSVPVGESPYRSVPPSAETGGERRAPRC